MKDEPLIDPGPEPQPFDVVHPELKRWCVIVFHVDRNIPFICAGCGGMFHNRKYINRYNEGVSLCSWNCAIDFNDYLNWKYEMQRKGIFVNVEVWRRTNKGTTYFQTEGSQNNVNI